MWKGLDISRLQFDISKKDFVRTIKFHLSAFKEYKGYLEPRETFRYVVLMYDPGSDLWRNESNYIKRKYVAAKLAGFAPNIKTGKFTQKVTNAILGQDEEVNKIIVSYISSFGFPELVELHGMLLVQENLLRDMINGDIDNQMDRTMSRVSDRIRELTRILFHSGEKDELIKMRKELYENVKKEEMPTPEYVANLLADTGDVPDDWNPYGNYKVEEMHFLGDDKKIAEELTSGRKH